MCMSNEAKVALCILGANATAAILAVTVGVEPVKLYVAECAAWMAFAHFWLKA